MPETRLDTPTLYQWQLNENSTRYDNPRAQLSEHELQIQFSILAFINALVAFSTFVLIAGILRSRNVRSSSFNLYLLFMAIPDFIGSFFCLFTCALSAPLAKYYSEAMCGFQSFYLVFAFCGNAWVNVVIVHEVSKLLSYSQYRRRYFPPKRHQVFRHVALVYTYAFVWGILAAFPISGMPFQSKAFHGYACFPMEQDEFSSYFLYFAFLPGILIVPLVYCLYVVGRIWWMGLLPQAGKRRALSLFLMRLILVYFLGWAPFLLLGCIGNFVYVGSWVNWVASAFSHFQGLISSVMVFYTNDKIRAQMRLVLRGSFFEERPSADTFFTTMAESSLRMGGRDSQSRWRSTTASQDSLESGRPNSVRKLTGSTAESTSSARRFGMNGTIVTGNEELGKPTAESTRSGRRFGMDGAIVTGNEELGIVEEASREVSLADAESAHLYHDRDESSLLQKEETHHDFSCGKGDSAMDIENSATDLENSAGEIEEKQ